MTSSERLESALTDVLASLQLRLVLDKPEQPLAFIAAAVAAMRAGAEEPAVRLEPPASKALAPGPRWRPHQPFLTAAPRRTPRHTPPHAQQLEREVDCEEAVAAYLAEKDIEELFLVRFPLPHTRE